MHPCSKFKWNVDEQVFYVWVEECHEVAYSDREKIRKLKGKDYPTPVLDELLRNPERDPNLAPEYLSPEV